MFIDLPIRFGFTGEVREFPNFTDILFVQTMCYSSFFFTQFQGYWRLRCPWTISLPWRSSVSTYSFFFVSHMSLMLVFFLFDLGQQQNHEKKREISSREFRNRFPELIRDRLDREAILSPLGSSLGLQCL